MSAKSTLNATISMPFMFTASSMLGRPRLRACISRQKVVRLMLVEGGLG
jgi:hypothetical protein